MLPYHPSNDSLFLKPESKEYRFCVFIKTPCVSFSEGRSAKEEVMGEGVWWCELGSSWLSYNPYSKERKQFFFQFLSSWLPPSSSHLSSSHLCFFFWVVSIKAVVANKNTIRCSAAVAVVAVVFISSTSFLFLSWVYLRVDVSCFAFFFFFFNTLFKSFYFIFFRSFLLLSDAKRFDGSASFFRCFLIDILSFSFFFNYCFLVFLLFLIGWNIICIYSIPCFYVSTSFSGNYFFYHFYIFRILCLFLCSWTWFSCSVFYVGL